MRGRCGNGQQKGGIRQNRSQQKLLGAAEKPHKAALCGLLVKRDSAVLVYFGVLVESICQMMLIAEIIMANIDKLLVIHFS